MACVALRPRKAAALTRSGVTDSKAFAGLNAHDERQRLIPKILECADHVAVMVVDVDEIDRRCRDNGLNRLEQERAGYLIERAPARPTHRLRRRAAIPPAASALAAARSARSRRAQARRRRRGVDRRQGSPRRAVGQDLPSLRARVRRRARRRRRRLLQRAARALSCARTSSATRSCRPKGAARGRGSSRAICWASASIRGGTCPTIARSSRSSSVCRRRLLNLRVRRVRRRRLAAPARRRRSCADSVVADGRAIGSRRAFLAPSSSSTRRVRVSFSSFSAC